jgi:hypothetical protein
VPELAAFLAQPVQVGFPTEYLLARIRGRRAQFACDWGAPPAALPEPPASPRQDAAHAGLTAQQAREKLSREFSWVYLQLDQAGRSAFAPFFLWFELRTMLVFLRLARGDAREKSATLLAGSLLAHPVQQALHRGGDAALAPLAELLEAVGKPARELGTLYREGKGRQYEELCVARYLEGVTRLELPPVLCEFFRLLVDQLNLLALAKQLRWQPGEHRAFVGGGGLAVGRLAKVLQQRDAAGLAALLRSGPGRDEPLALPENPEQYLLCRLTRAVRRLGRDPLGFGTVLAHLWECSVQSRNASLLHHAADLGEGALGAEVIR